MKESIYKNKFTFFLLALTATALWGTAFPGIKLGYDWFEITSTGSKIMFGGVRFIIAGILVLGVYAIKNKKLPIFSKKQAGLILSLSFVQIAGDYFFYYIGLSSTQGSVASVLNSFDTFCCVFAVSLFFKDDKLTFKKALGCLVGFAGIILVNLGGGAFSFKLTAEGFILISAVFSAFGIIINKKAAMKADPLIVTGYYLLIGGIILTVISVFMGGKISFASAKADACLLYLSLVSALAFLIWSNLLKHNNVSKTSMFKLMTPIFGNIFSALVLGENIFSPVHIVSVLLVAAGIGIVNSADNKKLNCNIGSSTVNKL